MKIGFVRINILKSFVSKEFRQILRDKRMKMMLFGSPVLMLVIFGYAVNTDVVNVKMAVHDSSRTYESREFVERFTSSGYFTYYENIESTDRGAALLDKGEIDFFMSIPHDFSSKLKKGTSAHVQIVLDGTDSLRSSVIMTYINQIVENFSKKYMKNKITTMMFTREAAAGKSFQSIELHERTLFNPDLASRNFYLPGVLGLLVALITIMMTAMSIVKERESGTFEQIIVSPIRPMEFIAGKALPFAIIGFVDIVAITLVAILWFKVPFNGSFILLLFCGFFYIISTLALGLYISTISQTQQQAMLSTFLFFLPSIMLSGFVFPIYSMPLSIQALTFLNPMRYFITIIRDIFLKGVGISFLWADLLGLIVLSAILLLLSVKKINRRFE